MTLAMESFTAWLVTPDERRLDSIVRRLDEGVRVGGQGPVVLALAAGQDGDSSVTLAVNAVQLQPNEPTLHVSLANVESAFGRNDDATQELLRAIRLYPLGTVGWDRLLVQAALGANDGVAARVAVEQAVTIRETAALRAGAARLEFRLGNAIAARLNAKRALELDPLNTEAAVVLREIGG